MAEDSSSHRLRWLLLAVLLGAVLVARSRRDAETAPAPRPRPLPPVPDEAQQRAGGTGQLAIDRLRAADEAEPVAPPQPTRPPQSPRRPAPVDAPTMELPVVDAPGGRTARARRSTVVEIPETAAAAGPDGSPPGPEYTIKAKSGSELFHGPDSPYFGRTRAEFWFRTAADARAAGFTEWTPRRRTSS